jgi:choline kinase
LFLYKEEIKMKKPVLVVMAAGMGSRYGGLKQKKKRLVFGCKKRENIHVGMK